MPTVTKRLGAYCDESSVVSITYDDATMAVSQFSATIVGRASCLVEVRNESGWTLVGSADLRTGTLAVAAPGSTTCSIDARGRFRLGAGRALCLIGTGG